jgi:flagellar export protein FliJ
VRPFRFRLAAVLTIWQRREEAARAIVLREQAATARARAHVAAVVAQREAARATPDVASGRDAGPHDPTWHRNWITHLTAQLAAAHDAVVQCVDAEAAARTTWQQTRRDRRVMERLRERASQRYAVAARRDEMKQMDELAGLRTPKGQAW